MTWDSDCIHTDGTPTDRFAYYGIDNYKTGQTVATLTIKLLSDAYGADTPVNIGILGGVPGATNLEERVAGVANVLKDHANITILHDETDSHYLCDNPFDARAGTTACATEYCDDSKELCSAQIEKMITTYPEMDAVIAVGVWPFFAYSTTAADNMMPLWTAAMRRAAQPMITVTWDTLDFEIDMAKENPTLLNAMIGQKYWGWGYDVIQLVYDHLQGKTVPTDATGFHDSGADVVCANNLDQMKAMWTSGDFTATLTPCSLLP